MSGVDDAGLIAFTQELVRIPSVHDPARGLSEAPAAELVAAQMRAFGWDPQLDVVEPGRPNVVAVVEGGGGPGPTLMFEGHTDVVTEGDGWTVDPFGGRDRRRQDVRPGRGRHEGRVGGDAVRHPRPAAAGAVPGPHRARRARRRGGHDARRQGPRGPGPHRRRRRRHLLRAGGRRDLPRRQGRAAAAARLHRQDGPRRHAVPGPQPEPGRRPGDRRAGRPRAAPCRPASASTRTSDRCGSRRRCCAPASRCR